MKKIELNNEAFNIPTSWSELSLKHYIQIRELEKKQNEMDFVLYVNTYINTLTQIPIKLLDNITPEDFKDIMQSIVLLNTFDEDKSLNLVWEHNKITYAFDLNIDNLKQSLDLERILKDKEYLDVAHLVTAIFIRPVTNLSSAILLGKKILKKKLDLNDYKIEQYDSNSLKERADLFYNHMPMTLIMNMGGILLSAKNN